MTITAIIITNQEKLNKFLLESLSFVDEVIVVIDSSVIDFAAQRNFALAKSTSDWVLFVDDDEYVGQELAREIPLTIASSKEAAFLIKRLDVVFHQTLSHGETGHIKMVRLARRNAGKFIRPVHEIWKINGRVGELQSPLYHIKDHFISEFIGRMSHYGQIDSQILTQEDKPFSYFRLLFYPKAKFFQNYLFKLGFLDGLVGFFQAYLMSIQSLTVRVFQWEKN